MTRRLTIKRLPALPAIKPLIPPAWALRTLVSKNGRAVYASSDTLFKGAVFGRDSIEVAEDLLTIKPRLVRRIILMLAGLQGEVDNSINEEEPGKIVHEFRTTIVDGRRLSDEMQHIYNELSSRWGGDEKSLAYYGSVDATPHYIRLLGRYVRTNGSGILKYRVTLRSGHVLSMRLVAENCVDWLVNRLSQSRSGLLEYQRRNPLSIENQVWKDSREFYVHANGKLANHNAPIASIEVQGLVYDALMAAAELLPNKAEQLRQLAAGVRAQTIKQLWLKRRHYFALGLDYDEAGQRRVITTLTANPAALLDSRLFENLPDKETYVSGIVKVIMGREFLTDAGIRSRGLSCANLIPFWDYHGSYTSWPKETYDIAKGLRRQGFPLLARELENRLLNVILKNRQYPEFVYVDGWGRVLASSPSARAHGKLVLVDSTNKPESVQAWTVSAVLAIVSGRLAAKVRGTPKIHQEPWQSQLEHNILTSIPMVKRLINPMALSARYPTYSYKLVKDRSRQSGSLF